MIQYALPGITDKRMFLNMIFVKLMQSAPDLFFDGITISSFYGNFPACIMNGGRLCFGRHYSSDQIRETMKKISEAGIITRLTFTNMFIKPEQFDDEYSNIILKVAQEHNAEVIVNSDKLGEYITNQYRLKLILSTTRQLNGVEELNKMLDRYNLVVLNYNHNKDDRYLEKIRKPNKLEVMPNELCEPHCPNRQKHYEHLSRCQLNNKETVFICPQIREKKGFTNRTESSETLLSNSDIRRLNSRYGIQHFKIVGRLESRETTIESYLYYLVQPQYRSVVYKIIKKKLFDIN